MRKQRLKNRRKINRLRDTLYFYCPLCDGSKITIKKSSITFKEYLHKKITKDIVISRLKETHFRHVHTSYDKITFEEFSKLKDSGENSITAKKIAKKHARQIVKSDVNQIRKTYKEEKTGDKK